MERRAITVEGLVQSVGFRPFVHQLAARHRLGGTVRNDGGAVCIEVEGEPAALDRFIDEVTDRPPIHARIERVSCTGVRPRGDRAFRIEPSGAAEAPAFISPDLAVCDDCLRELLDPADRRHRYAFTNCTNCGPRLTIITGAPYDRERTTMAAFAMCAACRAEYDNPADRRFHSEATACAACGPRLALRSGAGELIHTDAPLDDFAAALLAGHIGAVKGLGGYHLACDARNQHAVTMLRQRKHRDDKPLAIMVRDLAAAAALCDISPPARALLIAPHRPIVLMPRRPDAPVAGAIAPRTADLGVMLPYTPLHHLLLDAVHGAPLVMTSGNHSGEPIAYRDDDALERLRGIADLFLVHDRSIHVRCEDSVTRVIDGRPVPVRRSRGSAPEPIPLPVPCPTSVLAVGGQLKSTFALTRGRYAFLSHHLGDLDDLDAYRAFERDIALYEDLFGARPETIAHDLHPDYPSTRYAARRAAADGLRAIAVQHHHAHLAACMAEHGLIGPVIGVIFDGTGFGTDGTIWGGEFLIGGYDAVRRAAHLRAVGMPGGETAIREPWRMALSHLIDAGSGMEPLATRCEGERLRAARRMLERGFNTPLTTSAGRLFDAIASIIGLRDRVTYEGQAAAELEWLASAESAEESYPYEVVPSPRADAEPPPMVIDTRPLIRAVARDAQRGVAAPAIARRFHNTMADLIAGTCAQLRTLTGIDRIALSGGVFINALIAAGATHRLERDGFRVFGHRLVPPGDGGLALGQLAVAAARAAAHGSTQDAHGGDGCALASRAG